MRPTTSMLRRLLTSLFLLLGVPGLALAQGSIFLNGVNIDGTAVEIDRAQVRIDSEGNVHITAPGYQVQRTGPAPTATTPPSSHGPRVISGPQRPRARYWLATEFSAGARAGYDVDVFVNGELAARIREGDGQLSEELTGRLRAGKNTVRFVARKVGRIGRNEGSQTPFLKVHIGEGTEQRDRIVLQRPQVTFGVRADQKDHQTREFTLEAE